MEKNPLGTTGLMVSALGFGAAPIGYLELEQQEVTGILNFLLDSGVNLIDTAAAYEASEEVIGEAIGHRRGEFILVSKCGRKVSGVSGTDWSAALIGETIERFAATLEDGSSRCDAFAQL
jgi:aryl-alcohol dehydrogenase-like predicted oxidoreductase